MKRIFIATVVALTAGSFIGITTAYAHATLAQKKAHAGKRYKGVVTIAHGCAGSPTHTVHIQIPEGVMRTKPMPKPGWTLKTVVKKLDKPYMYHGKPITEDVRELVWTGGHLPDNFFDEFEFRAIMPKTVGATLYFKTVQVCFNGINRWIEIPEPGKTSHDYKEPAPAVVLTD